MAQSDLFDLQSTHNPHRWYLPVDDSVSVGPPGRKFLFGGVGLASSITAMERTLGRPTIWATSQYLSYAEPPSVVDIDVIVPKVGKHISQARVVGHVGDREIFTVNAALGARPDALTAQWAVMPSALPPEKCEPMPKFDVSGRDLHDRIDMRVAKGRYGASRTGGELSEDGQAILWARSAEGHALSSGLLAIIADYVPGATGHALGRMAGANSLDNTIRIRRLKESEWVLCDIRIHGIHAGFVHGRMHIFAQDGELLATASQSGILRVWDEAPG
ncbi:MAG: acyl-CoA thioesterase [Alphaproteobacteria bacterium]|nr:acyl-CoA thioesterase [Alphaproteobacteria bacterium]